MKTTLDKMDEAIARGDLKQAAENARAVVATMASGKTVRDLINKLTSLTTERPELLDAVVSLEGCDCVGDWSGRVRDERYYLLLER